VLGGWRWHSGPWGAGADPIVARDGSGRLVLLLRDEAGTMHTAAQTVPNSDFGTAQTLGGPGPYTSVPALALAGDGCLALVARGEDRHLYRAWQMTPGGEFGPWHGLGGPWSGEPTLVAAAGRVAGTVQHRRGWRALSGGASGDGGEFGDWHGLGGNWDARCPPVAASNADGRLEVFTTDADGAA